MLIIRQCLGFYKANVIKYTQMKGSKNKHMKNTQKF